MQKVKANIEDNAFRPAPKWIEYEQEQYDGKDRCSSRTR